MKTPASLPKTARMAKPTRSITANARRNLKNAAEKSFRILLCRPFRLRFEIEQIRIPRIVLQALLDDGKICAGADLV